MRRRPPAVTSSRAPSAPPCITERSNPAERALAFPTTHTAEASACALSSASSSWPITSMDSAFTLPSSRRTTARPSSTEVVTEVVMPNAYQRPVRGTRPRENVAGAPACGIVPRMPHVSFASLVVVAAIAVVAPLLVGLFPRIRIPAVVLEIVAGIVIGPHGLKLIKRVDAPVQILALVGLAFLLFLAGLEIDIERLRGRLLRLACLGFSATLVLGLIAG